MCRHREDAVGIGADDADFDLSVAVPVAEDDLVAGLPEDKTHVAAAAAGTVVPLVVAVVIKRPEQRAVGSDANGANFVVTGTVPVADDALVAGSAEVDGDGIGAVAAQVERPGAVTVENADTIRWKLRSREGECGEVVGVVWRSFLALSTAWTLTE